MWAAFQHFNLRAAGLIVTDADWLSADPVSSLSAVQETVFGIAMFSMAILAPSGWILAHLEDYKKKE